MSRYDMTDYLTRRRYREAEDARWKASNKACDEPIITSKTKITKHSLPQQEDAPSIFRSMPLGSTLE